MNIISPRDDAETRKFYQQLCHYPSHVLRMTYEYFQEDLLQIMENLSLPSLLHELSSRNIPDLQKYLSLEHDRKTLARNLLQEIFCRGAEAVISLWVSLHVLRKDHGSPVLAAVLEELGHTGEDLPGEILLDEEGHHLPLDLREIQNQHKKHLYEKTENLIENKPPRCNQEEESFPFCTRYVTLIIASTHHFRERSKNELIATGARHEEYVKKKHHELQCISPNKMFRWCHRSRLVPHMVLVSGEPGVGKSTLMQKIVYDWVKGDLYQRFSFVFFFKFRELNRWDKVSLETLILHHYPYLWQQLGNILQDPEKLLFIFDGLDESNQTMDFTSRHLCSDPKQPERCGDIVVSLVRKSLLTGCSVLMTSRPTRLASMDCRDFQRMVEISGFFTEERKIYFDNFFRDPELAEKAFTYVKQNDTLYTFCYLPSYCWIICTVLSRSFQTTSSDQQVSLLPRTVTQLFAIYVANILSNHSLEKSGAQKLLQSMGWMAEHGVMNHTIIFDDRDLESFHVDNKSKLLSSFLMESEEPVSYSFLHLTVQEFFSAFVHYADYSPEKLQKSLEKAKSYPDGRGEMFLRFLCGLSDATTRSLLTGYLDTRAAQASRDVITWLKNFITGGGEEEEKEGGEMLEAGEEERLEESENKKQLLRTFFYLFETRNKVLVQESLQSHRTLDLSYVPLSALDCTMLSFIIECCSHIEGLHLSGCSITPEGLERLAPGLHNLRDLRLDNNVLPDTSCVPLASVIRNNPDLKILVLSGNSLAGPDLRVLLEALSGLCRLERLGLGYNNLPDTSCVPLASVIRNNLDLKTLVLSGNSLAGPDLRVLLEALSGLCRLERLGLGSNDLSDTSCVPLASVIRNNPDLKILVLSGNRLAGPDLSVLLEALSGLRRLEGLYLRDNGFSKEEKEEI
ncbi:NACHT, LRR and PYD domains-containing protein 12-like isoform X1 [Engystomops pustulosus]|uniref:NACHT, LRR and PYD domains-containing protein 12-like isoform X1 n=1 Tax=Engystomops pustulosus TaxID=76066 RepID=UPI003AFAE873